VLVAVILVLSFSLGASAQTDQEAERYKIAYLMNAIGSSDLVFIRNGAEYTGGEAKSHLQDKLDIVGVRVHTAEDFIVYVGSTSNETGLPYYVRLADGTQMESGTWLRIKLAEIK
jgi:hypothetical protein